MADSKRFMMRRRIFLLSVACSLLAVCVVAAAAPAPAPADHDPSISSNGTSTTTLDDLDTDGRSASCTLCLHRASTEAYDGVVALKDGSGRLLCWKRDGQVWLSAGTTGSGYVLQVGGKALIDLRTRVSLDSARGRVYSLLQPTRRVFSMALSDESQSEPSSWGFPLDYYGGQIMFRPTTTDPNLYLVTGPAQTDGQLQAKILRFPVGQGNGTVTAMEYASISGVPRGCSFYSDRPHDLYCAIVVEVCSVSVATPAADDSSSALPLHCADDTHTKEAPTSTKSTLNWIFGVIGGLIAIFGGGYGAHKYITRTCSCFNRMTDIRVNATNLNIHNGEIQLTEISTEG